MTECVFCKIVAGEIPSEKIYESDFVLAFLDVNPFTEGHTLIIPKKHFENIFDLPEEILKEIAVASKKVSELLKNKLTTDGINLVNSNGKAAQQDVPHYHLHLIPRYSKDEFKFTQVKNKKKIDIKNVIKKIRSEKK